MRGSPVEWTLLVIGGLGLVGLLNADFHASGGLMVAGGVAAVLIAIWALSAHPKPKTVRSPLLGTRRLSSPFSPPLLVFLIALPAGWLFMVYGLGMTAAWVMGTERTRHGLVLDSLPGYTVKPRRVQLLGRQSCTPITVLLQTDGEPVSVSHCDTYLGGMTLPPGQLVTYRTQESAFGMFIDLRFRLPEMDRGSSE